MSSDQFGNAIYPTDGEWHVTDPDCGQMFRKVGEKVYEFKELLQLSPEQEPENYQDTIDLGDYTFEEMCDHCSPFGYDADQVKILLETHPALIAECIFEMSYFQ